MVFNNRHLISAVLVFSAAAVIGLALLYKKEGKEVMHHEAVHL